MLLFIVTYWIHNLFLYILHHIYIDLLDILHYKPHDQNNRLGIANNNKKFINRNFFASLPIFFFFKFTLNSNRAIIRNKWRSANTVTKSITNSMRFALKKRDLSGLSEMITFFFRLFSFFHESYSRTKFFFFVVWSGSIVVVVVVFYTWIIKWTGNFLHVRYINIVIAMLKREKKKKKKIKTKTIWNLLIYQLKKKEKKKRKEGIFWYMMEDD